MSYLKLGFILFSFRQVATIPEIQAPQNPTANEQENTGMCISNGLESDNLSVAKSTIEIT